MIQDGEADVVITGASESPISPISMACFDPIKATSQRNDDPAHASRPFDRDRDGFVMGEGGAVLVVEEMEAALARGAHIYCEVTGFAGRGNAYHMTGLTSEAEEMTEAILDAMRQGGTNPEDIDYINAHGSGTKQNDRHETAAYKKALGERAYEIPISSIKSMIGHSLGAIGAIEMSACALAIDRGVVPPTANWENPDPECDLDYTPSQARRTQVDVALSTGSGFGGFQSAMIFSLPPEVQLGGHVITSLPDTSRRAVVTGIGVVAPERNRHRRLVEGHRRGHERHPAASSASIRRSTTAQLAGEVDDFAAEDYIEKRLIVQTDHWTHMALAATQMALEDAELDPAEQDPRVDERDHGRAPRAATSSARRRSRRCGRRGRSSSAPTSRSPGSTPQPPARSRSATR